MNEKPDFGGIQLADLMTQFENYVQHKDAAAKLRAFLEKYGERLLGGLTLDEFEAEWRETFRR